MDSPFSNADSNPYVSPQASNKFFCTACGAENYSNALSCAKCGKPLLDPRQYVSDNSLATLIPYKNAKALWAYYLGIFSLFSCIPFIGFFIGLPLGIAALVLGLKGRNFSLQNPEAKGDVHAWVGIILGALSIVVSVFFLVAFVYAIIFAR